MKLVSYWQGPFGRYEIPQAILWLADAANARIGLPSVSDVNAWDSITACSESPGYRVIAEWGAWRDAEQEKSLRQEAACAT